MRAIIVKENARPSKLFVLKDNELRKVNLDKKNNWYFDEKGVTEGFEFQGQIYADSKEMERWANVDFKILNTEADYYGAGYDKVTCLINNEKVDLIESKWKGQDGYYSFEDENKAAV